jgi:hypothetical protein
MASGKSRRPFVQCGLAISHRVLWEVREAEEARLLWLALLLQVPRIHCGRSLP